jgi:hypothetical protein
VPVVLGFQSSLSLLVGESVFVFVASLRQRFSFSTTALSVCIGPSHVFVLAQTQEAYRRI